jgi:hypothetical protein
VIQRKNGTSRQSGLSHCSQRVQDWRKEKENPLRTRTMTDRRNGTVFVKRSRRGTSEKVNTNQAVESRALQDGSSNERSGPTIGHVYVLDSLNHVPPAREERENLTIESHGDGIWKRKLVNCLNTPHT